MHSRSGQADEHTQRYPVLADEPVEVRNPRRKARMIAASFAATIVLTGATAYAGTTYAVHRAESDLQHSRKQFAADLEERRLQRTEEQAAVGRDLCTVVTRLPFDPETDAMRRKYRCGPFVTRPQESESTPNPGPRPRHVEKGLPGTAPSARPEHRPAPRPAPAPPGQDAPPPRPSTPPGQQPPTEPSEDPEDGLRVCLPLLGCLL